jgi:hypothetical protein
MAWADPSGDNNFAITNINGFERWGGTALSNQLNFTVRYTGVVHHTGGLLGAREADDDVEDGVWIYAGGAVGSSSQAQLLLEVHGFAWPDATDDEAFRSFSTGDVPVEIVMVRCAEPMTEARVELKLGGGPWRRVGHTPTAPDFPADLFPPAID